MLYRHIDVYMAYRRMLYHTKCSGTAGLRLETFFASGAAGILLGLMAIGSGFLLFLLYQLFLPPGKRNALGMAIGTIAGNAVLTPAVIATADPAFSGQAAGASSMLAAGGMVTFILCPVMVAALDHRMRRKQKGIYAPKCVPD